MDTKTADQQWEQPLISVDVVPIRLDRTNKTLTVSTANRLYEPFVGTQALPGVLLIPEERVSEAAARALETKLDLNETSITYLSDIGVSDNPNRDPRGATLSVVFLGIIDANTQVKDNSGVQEASITEAAQLNLPFDHLNITIKAVHALEERILTDKETTRALLGEAFTTSDVQTVFKTLSEVTNRREENLSNLSRKLRLTGWFNEIENRTVTSSVKAGRGRPSVPWTWK